MSIDQVRHYVDNELPAEELAQFERALQADHSLRAMVEFERSLRGSIARQMVESTTDTPAAVRDAVAAALVAPVQRVDHDGGEDVQGPIERLFAGPTRANILAVAACLLIVVGAVIVGVFGDEWGLGLRTAARHEAPGDPNLNIAVIGISAEQAGAEHHRTMGLGQALLSSIPHREPAEIQSNLSDRLGMAAPVFDLSTVGLTLAGGQACPLNPLPDASIQLVYLESTPEREPLRGVSIFLQPDQGQFGRLENVLVTGRVYTPVDFQSCGGDAISMFSDGRTIYIIRAGYPGIQHAAQAEVLRSLAGNMAGSSQ